MRKTNILRVFGVCWEVILGDVERDNLTMVSCEQDFIVIGYVKPSSKGVVKPIGFIRGVPRGA